MFFKVKKSGPRATCSWWRPFGTRRGGLSSVQSLPLDATGESVKSIHEGLSLILGIDSEEALCNGVSVFDSSRTKQGPREKAHTQVDRAGVQGIDRVFQIQPQVFFGKDFAGPSDQDCGQIGPDSLVPALVGLGKRASLDRESKSHNTVKIARVRVQACLDISKRLSPSQPRKGHDSIVLGRRQRPHTRISLVMPHNSGETRPGNELHDLCKQSLADFHSQPPESLSIPGSYPFLAACGSNQHQTKLTLYPRPVIFSSFAGIILTGQ